MKKKCSFVIGDIVTIHASRQINKDFISLFRHKGFVKQISYYEDSKMHTMLVKFKLPNGKGYMISEFYTNELKLVARKIT